MVAWHNQSTGTTRSTVAQWDSASVQWIAYTTLDPGAEHVGPELALAAAGNPVVAYRSSGWVYVKKWDGGAWKQMGGAVTPNLFQSAGVALALTTGDVPIAAVRLLSVW